MSEEEKRGWINPFTLFDIIPLVASYKDTIHAYIEMIPQVQKMADGAKPHVQPLVVLLEQAVPHIQALNDLYNENKALLDRLEANLPQAVKFLAELQPMINRMAGVPDVQIRRAIDQLRDLEPPAV